MSRGSTLRTVLVGLALALGSGGCATDDPIADAADEDAAASSEGPLGDEARELAHIAPADACRDYCEAFHARCDGTLRADPSACMDTCRGWSTAAVGEPDEPIACRLAWLDEAGAGSCIAAGLDSPTCADA